MCSEDSKDIDTTKNRPKWDCNQADKNKHDKNYNWLYRLSRTSSKFTVLRYFLNEETERSLHCWANYSKYRWHVDKKRHTLTAQYFINNMWQTHIEKLETKHW